MKFVKEQLDAYDNMSGKEKKENSHIPLVMYGIAKAQPTIEFDLEGRTVGIVVGRELYRDKYENNSPSTRSFFPLTLRLTISSLSALTSTSAYLIW